MVKKSHKKIVRREGSPKISIAEEQSPVGKSGAKLPMLNKSLSKAADSNFRSTFNNTGMGKPGMLPKLPNQNQSVAKLKQLQAAMHSQ
jgi:hypothetical protein